MAAANLVRNLDDLGVGFYRLLGNPWSAASLARPRGRHPLEAVVSRAKTVKLTLESVALCRQVIQTRPAPEKSGPSRGPELNWPNTEFRQRKDVS